MSIKRAPSQIVTSMSPTSPELDFETRTLTADDARLMLMDNPINRRVSQPGVIKMSRDMVDGRWSLNPQPIMISATGRLIDGQHRLMALILADEKKPGMTITFIVARNVSETAFDVVDQGQPRSASQTLSIHGLESSAKIAAAARHVLRYEQFPDRIWSGGNDVTKAAVVSFVLKSSDEIGLLETTGHYIRRTRLNETCIVALNWLVIRHSQQYDQWSDFINGVLEGSGLSVGDPRLTLRNRVPSPNEAWGGGQGRVGLYIKAWNGFAEGREVKLLRFTRDNLPMPVLR